MSSYLTPQVSILNVRHDSESLSNADLYFSLPPMGQSLTPSSAQSGSGNIQSPRTWTPADGEGTSIHRSIEQRRARIELVMNFFRVVIVVVLAPMLYFLV